MKMRMAVFGCVLVAVVSACGQSGSTISGNDDALAFVDPAVVTEIEEPVPVELGAESGVLEYFASVDWLSEPMLDPSDVVRAHFASPGYPNETGAIQFGRHDLRGAWWAPGFVSWDDPLFDLANPSTETHPVVNYDYACGDGLNAYVSHYVHEHTEFHNAWQREDFLGEVDHDPNSHEATVVPVNDVGTFGHLRLTGVAGPLAGGEYAWSESVGIPEIEDGWLSYGYYQYFGFVDQDGTEVTVQITAPSFDFVDGWDDRFGNDPSPSILTEGFELEDILQHERVQSRFECGRELANRLAPIVAALDTRN